MIIAIHGVKLLPIAIHGMDTHGVKLYARCFTWE